MGAGLLHRLKSYGISGEIFGLISSLSNRQLWVVLDGKALQEYPVFEEKSSFKMLRADFFSKLDWGS